MYIIACNFYTFRAKNLKEVRDLVKRNDFQPHEYSLYKKVKKVK
jgi:hypothetical protein